MGICKLRMRVESHLTIALSQDSVLDLLKKRSAVESQVDRRGLGGSAVKM